MIRAVILKPLINEKSMALTKDHLYTFAVDQTATKRLIAQMVAKMFNVKVLSVKTINIAGKRKRQRGNFTKNFQERALKKAIVQVQKDQKIAVFEQVTEPEAGVATTEQAPVKEKKSLLRGTRVKIESRVRNQESSKKEQEGAETKDRDGRSGNVTGLTKNGLAGSSK